MPELHYTVLFTPTGADISSTQSIKSVPFTDTDLIRSRKKIMKRAESVAIQDNVIDPYAIRNDYWEPACVHLDIQDVRWDDARELGAELQERDSVDHIKRVQQNIFNVSVICVMESEKEREQLRSWFKSVYQGGIMLQDVGTRSLRVCLRTIGEIAAKDAEEAKGVYDRYRKMNRS